MSCNAKSKGARPSGLDECQQCNGDGGIEDRTLGDCQRCENGKITDKHTKDCCDIGTTTADGKTWYWSPTCRDDDNSDLCCVKCSGTLIKHNTVCCQSETTNDDCCKAIKGDSYALDGGECKLTCQSSNDSKECCKMEGLEWDVFHNICCGVGKQLALWASSSADSESFMYADQWTYNYGCCESDKISYITDSRGTMPICCLDGVSPYPIGKDTVCCTPERWTGITCCFNKTKVTTKSDGSKICCSSENDNEDCCLAIKGDAYKYENATCALNCQNGENTSEECCKAAGEGNQWYNEVQRCCSANTPYWKTTGSTNGICCANSNDIAINFISFTQGNNVQCCLADGSNSDVCCQKVKNKTNASVKTTSDGSKICCVSENESNECCTAFKGSGYELDSNGNCRIKLEGCSNGMVKKGSNCCYPNCWDEDLPSGTHCIGAEMPKGTTRQQAENKCASYGASLINASEQCSLSTDDNLYMKVCRLGDGWFIGKGWKKASSGMGGWFYDDNNDASTSKIGGIKCREASGMLYCRCDESNNYGNKDRTTAAGSVVCKIN